MARDFKNLDPQWAWSPFSPDARRPLDRRLAAHLHRRAGLAATDDELDLAAKGTPRAAVEGLFKADAEPENFTRQMSTLAETILATRQPRNLSAWWLYRMAHAPGQLRDKVTLFWHGHFATSAAKVDRPRLMLDQHRLLRRHALGPFEPLVQAISRDAAMLVYLDSATNRKTRPNENYARELLELFCLGEGNYGERDIREIARALTGWEVRRGQVRFNRYQHDTGEKTIFGQRGNFGGEDAVRIVLRQPSAATFIAGKLFRYFICDEPQPTEALIAPLAAEYREHNFDTGRLVRRILSSELFFSDRAIGRKVRSPVELGVGLVRALQTTTNTYRLAEDLGSLGQALFFPPSVKGWDGGRTWINSSTLLGRANLVARLVHDGDARFAGGTLEQLADRRGVTAPEEILDWLLELLVAVPIPDQARRPLLALLGGGRSSPSKRIANTIHALAALPEFQLA